LSAELTKTRYKHAEALSYKVTLRK